MDKFKLNPRCNVYPEIYISLSNPRNFLLLWKQKVRNRVHKIPPLDPIMNQLPKVHTFTPCFSKSHFNVKYFLRFLD